MKLIQKTDTDKFIDPQLTKHFQIGSAILVWSCYTYALRNNNSMILKYKMMTCFGINSIIVKNNLPLLLLSKINQGGEEHSIAE